MTDADLARLRRTLDLWTHMVPKMRPSPTSPGVARLDHFSGLFLERGEAEGEWLLEGRTWGSPALESVHQWHLLAAGGARELDPAVKTPERPPFRDARGDARAEVPDRPVGEVPSRRLAAFRHHLVRLS